MSGWLPLAITAATVGLLLLSGRWASKRFAEFDKLPGHFDFAGRATRMTSRSRMVWLLPITFSAMMVVVAVMIYSVPGDYGSAGPLPWLIFTGGSLLGSQVFVLWLTDRWAKQKRKNW